MTVLYHEAIVLPSQTLKCCQRPSSTTGGPLRCRPGCPLMKISQNPAPCTCHVTEEAAVIQAQAGPQESRPYKSVQPQNPPATKMFLIHLSSSLTLLSILASTTSFNAITTMITLCLRIHQNHSRF